MKAATIRGVVGQVKWSYYIAAAINGYTVTRGPDGSWSLQGVVVLSDAFKLSQRPLLFVAPHQHGEWQWPILECHILSGAITARLGAPIESKESVRT